MGCGFNPLNPLDPTGLINDTAKDLNPFGMGDPFVMMTSLDFNQNLKIMGESWTKIKHWLVPDMRRDREAMTNSALTNRRWVYGTCRVSGQLAYAESSGSKNEFLHLIVILASHPVASFQKVYLDDKPIEDYGTNASYKLFNGTQTTACAEMIAASAGKWTANHILKGCAYIYLQLTYDETLYVSGLPTVKVVLNGKPLYDPRTGLTTGISDPNVKVDVKPVDDQSGGYTGWNDNPALCARDYMLIPEELGGMGCTLDEIDDASIIAAADICDQWVYKTTDGSQQEKRFTCSGTFEINSTPKKILDALLQSMAGTPLFIQGKWRIFAGACGSTSGLVTLDESWLNGGISFKLGSNKSEKINTIKGTFVDPDDHWASKGFPPVTSAAYIAEDGGEELSEDITLNFTISPSMAQRLARSSWSRAAGICRLITRATLRLSR